MTSSPKPRFFFFFLKTFYKFIDTLALQQFPLYRKPLVFLSQSESRKCSSALLLLLHLHSKQSSWWYIRHGIYKNEWELNQRESSHPYVYTLRLSLAIATTPKWSCVNPRTSISRYTMMCNWMRFACDLGSQRKNFEHVQKQPATDYNPTFAQNP